MFRLYNYTNKEISQTANLKFLYSKARSLKREGNEVKLFKGRISEMEKTSLDNFIVDYEIKVI